MKIKIRNIRDVKLPEHIEEGNWIDLRCGENISLKKGDFYKIPLGISMKLPKFHEALVVPRSSTYGKYGLIQVNSIGIIDNSYSGDDDEWLFPVIATKDINIDKNTRLCQFRIIERMSYLEFVEVDSLGSNNRGGFGSTGEDNFEKVKNG